MRCPAKVSGPSAGQEIADVSLTAENELGRVRQEAAGGSQCSFPVVLTSGAGVNPGGRRGAALLSAKVFFFLPGLCWGKEREKCGSDSGLGNGLTTGVVLALEQRGLISGSLCPAEHSSSIPATAYPLLGFLSVLCQSQAAALPRSCLLEQGRAAAAGRRKPWHSCLREVPGEDQDSCLLRGMTVMRLASQHEVSGRYLRPCQRLYFRCIPTLRAHGKVQTSSSYSCNYHVSCSGLITGLACKSQNQSI